MCDSCLRFRLGPVRRTLALSCTLLIVYPILIGRFLFLRPPSVETVLYVILSPILILRNFLNALFSVHPLPFGVDYAVTLHDAWFSFGLDGDDDQMANHYSAIRRSFKVRGSWTLLLRDGWLVFLPPGDSGNEAMRRITARQSAMEEQGQKPN